MLGRSSGGPRITRITRLSARSRFGRDSDSLSFVGFVGTLSRSDRGNDSGEPGIIDGHHESRARPGVTAFMARDGYCSKWLIAVIVLGVVLAASLAFWWRPRPEEYRRYSSPDGQFQIVVFRTPSSFAMPGQGSDVPGYRQLRDARTGRVLRQRGVEMVQLVDRIEWSATNADVHLLPDWSLPR